MQTLHIQEGLGEKGRTGIAVEDEPTRIVLHAGIKAGASPDDYNPVLSRPAGQFGALFISHAHEDNVGALGWMLGQGYTGPVFTTPSAFSEMGSVLSKCANDADLTADLLSRATIGSFASGDEIVAGHSGHVAGVVQCAERREANGLLRRCFSREQDPPDDVNAGM